MAGEVSDDSISFTGLGTVMNFEPSLFVYFAEFFGAGEVGDWVFVCRWLAGMEEVGRGGMGEWTYSTAQIRYCADSLVPAEADAAGAAKSGLTLGRTADLEGIVGGGRRSRRGVEGCGEGTRKELRGRRRELWE